MKRLALFIDLGDAFTKVLAVEGERRVRTRFPSVIATRLMHGGSEMTELLLDRKATLPRPADFEAEQFPRTRSYPRSAEFVERVRERPPAAGSRFAGRIAALYGADRQLLGHAPTPELVDALVRKALILCVETDRCEAGVTFVLDTGPKAKAITSYASNLRTIAIEVHGYKRQKPRRLELALRTNVLDAPACLAHALPSEVDLGRVGPLLAVDIGFSRTKFALLSADGCEHQEEIDELGASDIVRRVLRDGQDRGLVEDEFAVMRALEHAPGSQIEIAGRKFEIGAPLQSAKAALEEELTRAARRTIVEHFRRSGKSCRAIVLTGGGALLVGAGLKLSIEAAGLAPDGVWIASDPTFQLVEGAHALAARDR